MQFNFSKNQKKVTHVKNRSTLTNMFRTCFITSVNSTAKRYLELVSRDVERSSVREAARLSATERSVLQCVLRRREWAG